MSRIETFLQSTQRGPIVLAIYANANVHVFHLQAPIFAKESHGSHWVLSHGLDWMSAVGSGALHLLILMVRQHTSGVGHFALIIRHNSID